MNKWAKTSKRSTKRELERRFLEFLAICAKGQEDSIRTQWKELRKMKMLSKIFLNEQIKNNLWIGLVAKTSKIAPRHVRLAMMYFNASVYIPQ
jgi:hypothetical protein